MARLFECVPILFADAGIPMIALTWPAMIVALIPVIAIEAALIRRKLQLKAWDIVRATTTANLASTILGIPLTWGALFLCEMGAFLALSSVPSIRNANLDSPITEIVFTIISSPWIGPDEKSARWAIPLASMVLLIPFYLVSVWSERRVMLRMLEGTTDVPSMRAKLWPLVRNANLVTYAILFVLTCIWLVAGVVGRYGTSQAYSAQAVEDTRPKQTVSQWELVRTVPNGVVGTIDLVVIPEEKQREREYYLTIANEVCGTRTSCMVNFWTDRNHIPDSAWMPVTDLAVQTASYERSPTYKEPSFRLSCWLYSSKKAGEADKCQYMPGAKVPPDI